MVTSVSPGVMKKSGLICLCNGLCNAVLLTSLCLPAQALTIASLNPATLDSESDQNVRNKSGLAFANAALSSFRSRLSGEAAAISSGLRRYQGIDTAAVAPEPGKHQPAVQIAEKKDELSRLATTNETQGVNSPLSKQDQATDVAQPGPAANKRLLLFAALILLFAILAKACTFAMRRHHKRKSTFSLSETPAMGKELERREVAIPGVAPENRSAAEELVIETGHLGPGMVPALLQRCADMPEPVVLKVTKGHCEKLVYFTGGRVSGALTQNATSSEPEVRWRKLGDLLVREKLVTKEDSDQGKALLATEPGLRFGEALLKLGLIDLAALRYALTRLAKVTIYSLILFPEGRYQIFADDGALPPEESVSLETTDLIREASHHQAEWTAIRKALPNLDKVLKFTPTGRSKLEKASISPQQEATLLLINGQHTINDLCIESKLMDYEVCRFLYLMVKAGVLN